MKTMVKFSILILCVLNVIQSFAQENPEISKINLDKMMYEHLLKSIKTSGDFSVPGVLVLYRYWNEEGVEKTITIKSKKESENLDAMSSACFYVLKDEKGLIKLISTDESNEAASDEYIYFNDKGKTVFYNYETTMDWSDAQSIQYFDISGKQIMSKNICHENDESGKSKVVKCEPIICPKSVTETLQTKKLKLAL